jgi:hypothetical protein
MDPQSLQWRRGSASTVGPACCLRGSDRIAAQRSIAEALVMKALTPLTVPEARAILLADEALQLSYEARLAAGQTFGIHEREAWAKLVESATDRIAVYEGACKEVKRPSSEPDRYPGGNEPDFQTLAMEAAAVAKRPLPDAEALALRTGIETILKAFGTNSAEWAQQFRGLLDRVPATRRTE